MRGLTRTVEVTFCLFMVVGLARAQASGPAKTEAHKSGTSDAAYIAKALTAAPPAVAKGAGVARIDIAPGARPALAPERQRVAVSALATDA